MPTPQNIFGWIEPRIISRLDYYGQPYEQKTIIKKLPNKGDLWKSFTDSRNSSEQKSWEAHVYVSGQHQPVNEGQVEKYFDNQKQYNDEQGNY